MALVTTKQILLDAQEGHYAVGAFNVENMEMVMAVIEAAEELKSPVILQTTPSTIKYAGLDYYLANVKVASEKASVPVAMHLDHGS
ncbi:fructose-bisphosphate aldolase class-II family protein, partial [Clostridioides difficile 842]